MYLKRVRHVGGRRAERLLELYGEDVLEVIDRDPQRRLPPPRVSAPGGSPRRSSPGTSCARAGPSTSCSHRTASPGWSRASSSHYGPRAHRIVRERPYDLTSVFGIGFQTADTIARSVDVPAGLARARARGSPARPERGGARRLDLPARSPSSRRGAGELARHRAGRRSTPSARWPTPGTDDAGRPSRTRSSEADAGTPPTGATEPVWAYRPETAKLERDLAEIVARARRRAGEPRSHRRRPPADDLVPAPEQAAAVRAAFASRLSIVTGGPGTGKTATDRLICAAASEQKASVLLVAPTGRAARRMSESSGLDASTVHSALGWIPDQGPTVEELDTDVLIVDETSMANLELLVTLLGAAGPRPTSSSSATPISSRRSEPASHSPSSSSRPVPIAELTHIFRQAAGSMIVRGAHAVRTGSPPSFAPSEGMTRDLFMIERADPRAALDEVVTVVTERLPNHSESTQSPTSRSSPPSTEAPSASTPSTLASANPSTRRAASSSAAASASATSSCSPAETSTTSAS